MVQKMVHQFVDDYLVPIYGPIIHTLALRRGVVGQHTLRKNIIIALIMKKKMIVVFKV